jgi:asparagine synthase (glutamine-hydrolysing)
MCGISGYFDFTGNKTAQFGHLSERFRKQLQQRGPDDNGDYMSDSVLLTHNRLSVIDTSERASQPMKSHDGSCLIVFNGEIFNFKTLRKELENEGVAFCSDSDTEVVLAMYVRYGIDFLEKLNGFFALAIWDSRSEELVVARDRFGIKPLLFFQDDEKFIFSSEMKSLLEAAGPQEIDQASLQMYFRLTYIPPPYSIFKNVQKLIPGCYLKVNKKEVVRRSYYSLSSARLSTPSANDYSSSCKNLYSLMDQAVMGQLISDVPLGCFLSGGIDSSIVAALAAQHTDHLQTFSIGFRDEPYYDETEFARLVAKKHRTEHTVFSLTNDDLFESVEGMLNYIDEPFADSSGLAVYVLSRETRKHVTVALSGDGADEMFGGYNRHVAEARIRKKLFSDIVLKSTGFIWNSMPSSRFSKGSDRVRKIRKYLALKKLSAPERYRFLTSFTDHSLVDRMVISYGVNQEFIDRWDDIAADIDGNSKGIEDVMRSDMKLVLAGDMLPKVDMMSMAHSLEVRPPFLDNSVVEFAFSIPTQYKISGGTNKKILRDTFRTLLPDEIMNRPKHGFEVPMNTWFKTEMRPMIDRYLQSSEFVSAQKLFRHDVIGSVVDTVLHQKHHDYQAVMWSLLVFQHWYDKYEHLIKKDWK